jgi:hypothetical protein
VGEFCRFLSCLGAKRKFILLTKVLSVTAAFKGQRQKKNAADWTAFPLSF